MEEQVGLPEINTTIEDVHGVQHEYNAVMLPPDISGKITMSVMGPMILSGISGDDSGQNALLTLFEHIASNTSTMLDQVFTGCRRKSGGGRWQLLDRKSDRTEAYTGNLGEMIDALKWILKENFGPFWQRISELASEI